ncbi:DNA-3-methyladenine glycosylase [Stappia sp. ES.058]|uniref:DNA-3-methyladenine glycosylase family protein n=1 Tax=Stappia sp. ES.058 TaxID=1881061 RepID=UPI00087922D1|nr:DNA-3-methyladenine glycosylase [Stappia sp. ES.058]SDU41433.1 DNA-3-methyladenine glycosylase II [Stappia sp. ES.058]
MHRIETGADLEAGLARLLVIAPELRPVAERAGPLPLRRSPADLKGLVRIVTAQQVSLASAATIFSRLETLLDPFDLETLARTEDGDLATAGLSRPKIATVRAVSDALDNGLDLAGLGDLPGEDAQARLEAIKGIGPWSAEVFLLFCLGHPDVFPAGDLALREAIRHAFDLDTRPEQGETRARAQGWKPCRGVAARLFWGYYRSVTGRGAGLPA